MDTCMTGTPKTQLSTYSNLACRTQNAESVLGNIWPVVPSCTYISFNLAAGTRRERCAPLHDGLRPLPAEPGRESPAGAAIERRGRAGAHGGSVQLRIR